jgi:hypothetical protein
MSVKPRRREYSFVTDLNILNLNKVVICINGCRRAPILEKNEIWWWSKENPSNLFLIKLNPLLRWKPQGISNGATHFGRLNCPRASICVAWQTRKWPRGANCPFASGGTPSGPTHFGHPNVFSCFFLKNSLISTSVVMNLWKSMENKRENKLYWSCHTLSNRTSTNIFNIQTREQTRKQTN